MSTCRGQWTKLQEWAAEQQRQSFEATPITWPPKCGPDACERERQRAASGATPELRRRLVDPFLLMPVDERRALLFRLQDGLCCWCSDPMQIADRTRTGPTGIVRVRGDFGTFEHIKPRSEGGKMRRDNIALAHESCNRKRHGQRRNHPRYAALAVDPRPMLEAVLSGAVEPGTGIEPASLFLRGTGSAV